jgi:hypothetical protein
MTALLHLIGQGVAVGQESPVIIFGGRIPQLAFPGFRLLGAVAVSLQFISGIIGNLLQGVPGGAAPQPFDKSENVSASVTAGKALPEILSLFDPETAFMVAKRTFRKVQIATYGFKLLAGHGLYEANQVNLFFERLEVCV